MKLFVHSHVEFYVSMDHWCDQSSVMVASHVTSYWKGNAYFMRDWMLALALEVVSNDTLDVSLHLSFLLARACFKKLPMILCFNTMRYTFNMLTMMKEKVNTHFSFPLELDMSPYMERNLIRKERLEGQHSVRVIYYLSTCWVLKWVLWNHLKQEICCWFVKGIHIEMVECIPFTFCFWTDY